MTPDDVGRYAESLGGVKRKGTEERPAWYVHARLVVRLHDPDPGAVREAIDLAWEMQHRRS